jgi:hypothetical protein
MVSQTTVQCINFRTILGQLVPASKVFEQLNYVWQLLKLKWSHHTSLYIFGAVACFIPYSVTQIFWKKNSLNKYPASSK